MQNHSTARLRTRYIMHQLNSHRISLLQQTRTPQRAEDELGHWSLTPSKFSGENAGFAHRAPRSMQATCSAWIAFRVGRRRRAQLWQTAGELELRLGPRPGRPRVFSSIIKS